MDHRLAEEIVKIFVTAPDDWTVGKVRHLLRDAAQGQNVQVITHDERREREQVIVERFRGSPVSDP